jgi:hypothetical protein
MMMMKMVVTLLQLQLHLLPRCHCCTLPARALRHRAQSGRPTLLPPA